MPKLLLSIIIPAFNAEKYISQAIQSILNQTYENFELIIINDGSTDKTKVVIESFKDKRIRYFENEKNYGIVVSRNRGLKLAQGEYIGMLDADDIAYPEKFEKQIDFLEKNTDFGLIGSWSKFIDEEGKYIPGGWKLRAKPKMIPSIMLFKNYFLQSAVLYRKSCISQYSFKEGFDILEDYLIWLEILNNFKVWNLQEYLLNYRIHGEGVTKKYKKEKLGKEKKVFRMQLTELGIDATEKEIELHLLIRNDTQISEISTLKSIENWMIKIISQNSKLGKYNHKILIRVTFNRWLKVCFKSKGLWLRMMGIFITSELLFTFMKSYLPKYND